MISPYVIPGLKGILPKYMPKVKQIQLLQSVIVTYGKNSFPDKDITWEAIQGKSRKRELVLLRHAYCYFCLKLKLFESLKAIGDTIGGRDHSTVLHANSNTNDLLDSQDTRTIELHQYIYNNLNN